MFLTETSININVPCSQGCEYLKPKIKFTKVSFIDLTQLYNAPHEQYLQPHAMQKIMCLITKQRCRMVQTRNIVQRFNSFPDDCWDKCICHSEKEWPRNNGHGIETRETHSMVYMETNDWCLTFRASHPKCRRSCIHKQQLPGIFLFLFYLPQFQPLMSFLLLSISIL